MDTVMTKTRAMVDFPEGGGPDRNRLARALTLSGEPVGDGQYRISGGVGEHWVDLYTAAHPRCDCGDHIWRNSACKHILAAMLREGDEGILRAVGSLFVSLEAKAA